MVISTAADSQETVTITEKYYFVILVIAMTASGPLLKLFPCLKYHRPLNLSAEGPQQRVKKGHKCFAVPLMEQHRPILCQADAWDLVT